MLNAGGLIRSGRFSRLNVGEVDVLLAAETIDLPAPAGVQDQLIALWPTVRDGLDSALRARQGDRTAGLLRDVRNRETQERNAITTILTELEAMIRRELHTPEVLQMQLFTDGDDREQAERDRNVLEDRLERIPTELEQELAIIRKRYEQTEPRLFPVAVTWLVPRSIALNARG